MGPLIFCAEILPNHARQTKEMHADLTMICFIIIINPFDPANQEQMQRLLTMRPHLAAARTLFTDWTDCTFKCSPFEYAMWTTDVKYMCPMMLDCLPKDEKGETIRVQLLEQAQSIQDKGLSYELKGKLTAVGQSYIPTTAYCFVEISKIQFQDGNILKVVNTKATIGDSTGSTSKVSDSSDNGPLILTEL